MNPNGRSRRKVTHRSLRGSLRALVAAFVLVASLALAACGGGGGIEGTSGGGNVSTATATGKAI
jgi:hypothetical protein